MRGCARYDNTGEDVKMRGCERLSDVRKYQVLDVRYEKISRHVDLFFVL